jgi:hypothetical protein
MEQVCAINAGWVKPDFFAAGIPLRHGVEAWIADEPHRFVAGIVQCVRDPRWAELMGAQGREAIEKVCGNWAVGQRLDEMLAALATGPPSLGDPRA